MGFWPSGHWAIVSVVGFSVATQSRAHAVPGFGIIVYNSLMKTLHSDISSTCMLADKLLWSAYARTGGSQPDIRDEGHLIFPPYRNKNSTRVSEQEARFAFVEALCRGPLRYSVEVPTTKLYSFSEGGYRSASTDLQVHGPNEIGICNVEFKAKGVSSSAKDNSSIYKDVQKLLREPVWGLWVHLLKSINRSSIKNFLDVIAEKIRRVQEELGNDVATPSLTLHICVLRHGFSLQKDILFPMNGVGLANQLQIDLCVTRDDLKKVIDLNGWHLERDRKQ